MNKVAAVAALLLLSMTACGGAASTATSPTESKTFATQPATSDAPAPKASAERLPAISLADLDGGAAVDLAKLRGPAVINLFATWCGPCRAELPVFARAHKSLGDQVTFIGIDFADPDQRGARALAKKTGITYQLLADPDATLKKDLKVIGLPQTMFVDAQGTIVATERRAFDSYADLSAALDSHLGVTP